MTGRGTLEKSGAAGDSAMFLKSYTKYPLYSHLNSLPPLIYIILINPACTHEQCVKKSEGKKNTSFEMRVCFIPAFTKISQDTIEKCQI